jgi:hypothetical protein
MDATKNDETSKKKNPPEEFGHYDSSIAQLSKAEAEFAPSEMALFNARTLNSNLQKGVSPSSETIKVAAGMDILATVALAEEFHIKDRVRGSRSIDGKQSNQLARAVREKSLTTQKTIKPQKIATAHQIVGLDTNRVSAREPRIILPKFGDVKSDTEATPIPSHTLAMRICQMDQDLDEARKKSFGEGKKGWAVQISNAIKEMTDEKFVEAVNAGLFDEERIRLDSTGLGLGGANQVNVGSVELVKALNRPEIFLPPVLSPEKHRAFGIAYHGPSRKKFLFSVERRLDFERHLNAATDITSRKKILKPIIKEAVQSLVKDHSDDARFLHGQKPMPGRLFDDHAGCRPLQLLYEAIVGEAELSPDELKAIERNLRRRIYDAIKCGEGDLRKCAKYTRSQIIECLFKAQGKK